MESKTKSGGLEGSDPKAKTPNGQSGGNGANRKPKANQGRISPTGQRWFRDLPRWMQDNLRTNANGPEPRKGSTKIAS